MTNNKKTAGVKPAVARAEECGLPDRKQQGRLRLVTKALLMTVGLHALAALVLADLGLPTLLEVAHGLFCWVIKFCGFLKPQFH
jgi:hypothetical protein